MNNGTACEGENRIDTRWFDKDKLTKEHIEATRLLDSLNVLRADDMGIPYTLTARIMKLVEQLRFDK